MSTVAYVNRFEYVIIASLRAAQLLRGCAPRVTPRTRVTATARAEVEAGKCVASPRVPPGARPIPGGVL